MKWVWILKVRLSRCSKAVYSHFRDRIWTLTFLFLIFVNLYRESRLRVYNYPSLFSILSKFKSTFLHPYWICCEGYAPGSQMLWRGSISQFEYGFYFVVSVSTFSPGVLNPLSCFSSRMHHFDHQRESRFSQMSQDSLISILVPTHLYALHNPWCCLDNYLSSYCYGG